MRACRLIGALAAVLAAAAGVRADCGSLADEFVCPFVAMKNLPDEGFVESTGFVYLSFEQVTDSTMVSAVRPPANILLDNETDLDDEYNKYFGNVTFRAVCAREGPADARCYSTVQSTYQVRFRKGDPGRPRARSRRVTSSLERIGRPTSPGRRSSSDDECVRGDTRGDTRGLRNR